MGIDCARSPAECVGGARPGRATLSEQIHANLLGDVDGDGYDDLVAAEPSGGDPANGVAYLVRGPISGTIEISASAQVFCGASFGARLMCAAPGVLDGDGLDGLVLASPRRGRDRAVGRDRARACHLHGPLQTRGHHRRWLRRRRLRRRRRAGERPDGHALWTVWRRSRSGPHHRVGHPALLYVHRSRRIERHRTGRLEWRWQQRSDRRRPPVHHRRDDVHRLLRRQSR
ncbi:MAG: hypothetical protein EXR71_04270 [Myxococcales bacterium]|nr:hypothetical protein [Myxococcales bacterium]